jgi:3-methyladenine DNA glycosylase AlkD
MNAHRTLDREITAHLHSLADPVRAARSQRYFKTGPGEYGAGDKFLGIRVPAVRDALRRYRTASVDTAGKLLKSPHHEIRLFALLLLVERYNKGSDAERECIYTLYFKLTRHINNWDLVDSSAPCIVGRHLLDRDRTILYDFARSQSLWERRIAIMATAWFIRQGQFHDTLRLAEMLLNDPEDLIHKATGWMLREIGKRDHAAQVAFLDAHHSDMPRTMLRYALERFEEEERKRYLAGSVPR